MVLYRRKNNNKAREKLKKSIKKIILMTACSMETVTKNQSNWLKNNNKYFTFFIKTCYNRSSLVIRYVCIKYLGDKQGYLYF